MSPRRRAATVEQPEEEDILDETEVVLYEPVIEADNGTPQEYRLELPAQLQDVKVSRASNGASYDVVFQVPMDALGALGTSPEGLDVKLNDREIGNGAEIRRMGVTRDPDGNRTLKIVIRFAQSEVGKSLGYLGKIIVSGATISELILESPQLMVFGATVE
jgi:hypothetical protein